jgi:hypothetical protein
MIAAALGALCMIVQVVYGGHDELLHAEVPLPTHPGCSQIAEHIKISDFAVEIDRSVAPFSPFDLLFSGENIGALTECFAAPSCQPIGIHSVSRGTFRGGCNGPIAINVDPFDNGWGFPKVFESDADPCVRPHANEPHSAVVTIHLLVVDKNIRSLDVADRISRGLSGASREASIIESASHVAQLPDEQTSLRASNYEQPERENIHRVASGPVPEGFFLLMIAAYGGGALFTFCALWLWDGGKRKNK